MAQQLRTEQGEAGEAQVLRLSLAFRLQHILLFVSTITLIVTGLPLRYPDSHFARLFFALSGGVEGSGLVHRIGAAALIALSIIHTIYLLTPEGRREFRSLLPRRKDFRDVWHNLLYFLGRRRERAQFDRFSYFEKFDYWAVYWGMVIMIGTGLVLWFEGPAMRLLPKLALDMAKEAHSDEALLAALAIIVWHFYNVHLNPDHFPINWAWWTGKVSLHKMRRDHPLEYMRLMAAQGMSDAAPKRGPGNERQQAGAAGTDQLPPQGPRQARDNGTR